jgi:hypothetical protein
VCACASPSPRTCTHRVSQDGTVGHISAVHAQDLRGDHSVDVTQLVALDRVQDTVTLSGELIASVGTSAKTPGDLSEPGLVISFTTGSP